MPWYSGLESVLRRDEPLARWTSLRIGGPAAFFLAPPDEDVFAGAYAAAVRSGLPVRILGAGSNILVCDGGVQGAVLSTGRLTLGPSRTNGTTIRVGAGKRLADLLRWTARQGLGGLECLAGIPGTVGGAVRMNAGGRRGSIDARVNRIWCADRAGNLVIRNGDDIRWGYRSTDIQDPITAVEFVLESDRPKSVADRIAGELAERRRLQPVRAVSAGCFFKNPPRRAAGRLIEMVGLKGCRLGGARISEKHANFIVNAGGATAADVLRLCRMVHRSVRERFGILLEKEICFWPEDALGASERSKRCADG